MTRKKLLRFRWIFGFICIEKQHFFFFFFWISMTHYSVLPYFFRWKGRKKKISFFRASQELSSEIFDLPFVTNASKSCSGFWVAKIKYLLSCTVIKKSGLKTHLEGIERNEWQESKELKIFFFFIFLLSHFFKRWAGRLFLEIWIFDQSERFFGLTLISVFVVNFVWNEKGLIKSSI